MTLLLESLRIENYRVFKRLEIPHLGRVNLLVGRNNSGKSSVLEAVRLYATRGAMEAVQAILESHDEARLPSSLKQLFHGRDTAWRSQSEIRIGPFEDDRVLVIGISDGKPAVGPTMARNTRYAHVSPHGLTTEATARLWDLIALTDLEAYVTDALRIISPDIERISFVAEDRAKRVPLAKLSTHPRPVALRSLGDGVNRLLGIALSLAYASGGVLLIDEVENGIHFTAQQRLWELIFRLSHRLDTQVFATTHSWDCIEAFQLAAAADPNEEAVLVRLDVHADAVSPTTFSERELAIVTRERIEVR
ncbi:MAG TPA: AAA family ATPase [Thermoanaerobaculia bacterium]